MFEVVVIRNYIVLGTHLRTETGNRYRTYVMSVRTRGEEKSIHILFTKSDPPRFHVQRFLKDDKTIRRQL